MLKLGHIEMKEEDLSSTSKSFTEERKSENSSFVLDLKPLDELKPIGTEENVQKTASGGKFQMSLSIIFIHCSPCTYSL